MAGGFNSNLFNENYAEGCYPCGVGCLNMRRHNEIDLRFSEGIPDILTIEIQVCIGRNYDDIVYRLPDEAPTTTTIADVGDKAYNLWDMKSWTCTNVTTSGTYLYTWVQDTEFTAREHGDTLEPMLDHYYEDKLYNLTIMNHLYEPIHKGQYQAASPFKLPINQEMLKIMKKGIYRYQIDLLKQDGTPMLRMANAKDSAIMVV